LSSVLFILVLTTSQTACVFSVSDSDRVAQYFRLGLEATDWISSFQVTPSSLSWGIPYHDERAWGLDPYYYANGTITPKVGGIKGGEKQRLAFLIGGHDSGLGASAALDAYLRTKEQRYLDIFRVYFEYFQRSQIPSSKSGTPAQVITDVAGRNVTLDNDGFWAEQSNVAVGADEIYGTSDDDVRLLAVFPAAEHGNPIAAALIAYYRLTGDHLALDMLNRYGNWLIKTQIKSGEFSGSFPVTQYYWALGWKPRMYETTESAWILTELYLLTGNRTYLDTAVSSGFYMLSRQFSAQTWNDTRIDGALPYESNQTRYSNTVSTNHAGFTLLAWTQLFRLTKDDRFLSAAKKYANWLMSFQVTEPDTPWGDHVYANDTMAIGGFYYGYNTEKHDFEWRVALSLWSAAYAIRGLLFLTQLTNDQRYLQSALMAADWLTRMRFSDRQLIPLQSLAVIKHVFSSWWGLYPQFYQPDMRQVEKAGIPTFVERARADSSVARNQNPTWFERAFEVDFNSINYQMASRGDQYMKMIWGWWPDVGFEPRYGGDVAFGAFAIANFLTYKDRLDRTQAILRETEQLKANVGQVDTEKFAAYFKRAQELLREAGGHFDESWYSVAVAKVDDAAMFLDDALKELKAYLPVAELRNKLEKTETVLKGAILILVLLVILSVYWHRELSRLSGEHRRSIVLSGAR